MRLPLPLKKMADASMAGAVGVTLDGPLVVIVIVPGVLPWVGSMVSAAALKLSAFWRVGGVKLVPPTTSQLPLLRVCVVVMGPLHVPSAHDCAIAARGTPAVATAPLKTTRSAVEACSASLLAWCSTRAGFLTRRDGGISDDVGIARPDAWPSDAENSCDRSADSFRRFASPIKCPPHD